MTAAGMWQMDNAFRLHAFDSSLARAELGPKTNLGRLNNAMKNIGRNVKNTAVVAVEKIGAGIQGKVPSLLPESKCPIGSFYCIVAVTPLFVLPFNGDDMSY